MVAPDSLAIAGIGFLVLTCIGMLTGAIDRVADSVWRRPSAPESKG